MAKHHKFSKMPDDDNENDVSDIHEGTLMTNQNQSQDLDENELAQRTRYEELLKKAADSETLIQMMRTNSEH